MSGATRATSAAQSSNDQHKFFKHITDLQLNEFLYRVETRLLARHIVSELHARGISNIKINTKLTNVNNEISAYINVIYNGMKRLHISFHLTGIDFTHKVIGPIHAVNNTRKRVGSPMRFKRTQKLSCNISHRNAGTHCRITNKVKLDIITTALDVLNNYFISSNPYYLDTLIATPPNTLHPYLLTIISFRKNKGIYPIIQTTLTSHLV